MQDKETKREERAEAILRDMKDISISLNKNPRKYGQKKIGKN